MPSFSSKKIIFVSLVLILTSCARSAPPLPPESTSANDSNQTTWANCSSIEQAIEENQREKRSIESKILANRGANQATGMAANLFFTPLWLAADTNSAEKEQLDALQLRWDELMQAKKARACR